jgi:hypothetical protein
MGISDELKRVKPPHYVKGPMPPKLERRIVAYVRDPRAGADQAFRNRLYDLRAWAAEAGLEIIGEVREPFDSRASWNPTTWTGLSKVASLAERLGVGRIVIAHNEEATVSWPFFHEQVKWRIFEAYGLTTYHDKLPAEDQDRLSQEFVQELGDAVHREDLRRHALLVKGRLNQAIESGKARPGRREKPLSSDEIEFLRREFKPGVQGHGYGVLARKINEMRGITAETPAARRSLEGISSSTLRQKIQELGLIK